MMLTVQHSCAALPAPPPRGPTTVLDSFLSATHTQPDPSLCLSLLMSIKAMTTQGLSTGTPDSSLDPKAAFAPSAPSAAHVPSYKPPTPALSPSTSATFKPIALRASRERSLSAPNLSSFGAAKATHSPRKAAQDATGRSPRLSGSKRCRSQPAFLPYHRMQRAPQSPRALPKALSFSALDYLGAAALKELSCPTPTALSPTSPQLTASSPPLNMDAFNAGLRLVQSEMSPADRRQLASARSFLSSVRG